MKTGIKYLTVVAALAFMGNAVAASITLPTLSIVKGTSGTLSVAFTGDASTTQTDFTISYDDAVVDETSLAIDCSNTIPELAAMNCSIDTTNNLIKAIGVNFGSTVLSSTDPMAVITLPILAGAATGDSESVFSANFFAISTSTGPQVDVPWTITVTDGPEPAYNGVAAGLTMNAAQEGDTDPTGSVTITNTGDAGTTLAGTCSLTGGDTEISLTSGGFSVAQGSAGAVVAVACDASAEGSYASTVSCAHNGTNVSSPVTYPVTCEVGPAGAASYISTPAIGSTIEMTPEDVPTDTAVADQVLIINNGASDPADNDLILTNCGYTGDAAITVGVGPASPIAPNGSSSITFSCDTTTIGDYTGTYSCDYSVDGGSTTAPASYPVHCGVRAAGSEVEATPGSGGGLSIVVPMNGTGFAGITFSEILDEGEDASVDSCTLSDGTDFVITTALPLVIPAGGSVQVQVQGTDPGDGSLGATDVLTCQITDSNGTTEAVWNVQLTVQTTAIPTLSTWGLLAMFLAMLSLGGIVIRRKSSI